MEMNPIGNSRQTHQSQNNANPEPVRSSTWSLSSCCSCESEDSCLSWIPCFDVIKNCFCDLFQQLVRFFNGPTEAERAQQAAQTQMNLVSSFMDSWSRPFDRIGDVGGTRRLKKVIWSDFWLLPESVRNEIQDAYHQSHGIYLVNLAVRNDGAQDVLKRTLEALIGDPTVLTIVDRWREQNGHTGPRYVAP
jgi:hypothetical protein